jgi:hypothetical protein
LFVGIAVFVVEIAIVAAVASDSGVIDDPNRSVMARGMSVGSFGL